MTLSKALGGQGGAVLGARAVIAHLVDTARSFIFDTGLAPACVGAALAALGCWATSLARPPRPGRRGRDRGGRGRCGRRAGRRRGVGRAGRPARAVAAAAACADRGLRVGCFRPPSVPEGTAACA